MSDSAAAETTCRATDDYFSPGRFALFLAGLIAVSFSKVVFLGQNFVFRDFGLFGYPLAAYHRESFWRGEIPLWNPFNDCGVPFLAQWNTLTLYPGSLIYLLLPLPWSLSVFCLAHLFGAGFGMYFLARRWTGNNFAAAVAGTAFAFNGLSLNSLMWPNDIAGLSWMPWVILTAQTGWREGGRKLVIAALVGAIGMLSGAPEIILFTWVLTGALWLVDLCSPSRSRQKILCRLPALVLIVALLSAAQLMPFMDLMAHSHRDKNFAADAWSMPAWGWANLLVPLFHCRVVGPGIFFQPNQNWTSSYYLGIGALALAILAVTRRREPRVWVIGAAALLGLLLALGDRAYIYSLLHTAVPLLGFMRFPIKFVVLPVFAVPLLAGLAVAYAHDLPREKWRSLFRNIIVAGIVLGLVTGAIVGWAALHPDPEERWSAVWRSGLTRIFFLATILSLVAFLPKIARASGGVVGAFMLLVLVWLDVWSHAPSQNPTVKSVLYEPGFVAARLKSPPQVGGFRVMITKETYDKFYTTILADPTIDYIGRRLALLGDVNLLDHLPTPDGFYSLYLREQRDVWHEYFFAPTNQPPEPLLDFLGVAQTTHPVRLDEWIQRSTALPMVTAGQKPIFADMWTVGTNLTFAGWEPARAVFLPENARGTISITNATAARILSGKFSAHKIMLEVEAAEPAMVVLAQSFYHPWRAYVDGAKTEIWHANHAFQALAVPAGRHRIEMKYEDKIFWTGVALSLLALAGCLAACFLRRTSPR